jgi:hypothetical protein
MSEETSGLSRALAKGDSVILSSGATASARSSYPAGYAGDVDLLLDGEEVTDEAESLVLPDTGLQVTASESGGPIITEESGGEVRGRSRRMED